jgi:hypothetical protein
MLSILLSLVAVAAVAVQTPQVAVRAVEQADI